MDSELLSVCIPTRNRAPYLRTLLGQFAKQVKEDNMGEDQVVFYVSDNDATDDTPDVVRELEKEFPRLHYSRNETNIGPAGNVAHVRTLSKGRFAWVIGDDELLCDKALVNVVAALREHDPGLLIAFNCDYGLPLLEPQVIPDYKSFVRECLRVNAHLLGEQTLISCNISRADSYDMAFANETVDSVYPHMHGIVRGMLKSGASVLLPDFPVIKVREQPAPPGDGTWENIDEFWLPYFAWLREELEMPEIDPKEPSRIAGRALWRRLLTDPIGLIRDKGPAMFHLSAYRFAFTRLFRSR